MPGTQLHPKAPRLRGRLSLETERGARLGESRVRLLEAIDREGSITRAAKQVPLSYKAAWDALDALNNLSTEPLVERSAGGRQGGGTRLTEHGRRMVAMYRAIEREQQQALDRVGPHLGKAQAATAQDVQQVRGLLKRLAVRSSARNQFVGHVIALKKSALGVEAILALDGETRIVAGITRESAAALGLREGSAAVALVKASSVLLAAGEQVQTSARNCLHGKVSRFAAGPISAEVTLALPAGRTVTAGITRESLDRLRLAKGVPAWALFKASSVILVALD